MTFALRTLTRLMMYAALGSIAVTAAHGATSTPAPQHAQPPNQTAAATPSLAGKYVRLSKHEYGVDTRSYELKPNHVAVFQSEEEGRDSAKLQGTWRWNAAEKTVTLDLADPRGKKERYVFRVQGSQLIMIEEPQHETLHGNVKPTGLVGTVYLKQRATLAPNNVPKK